MNVAVFVEREQVQSATIKKDLFLVYYKPSPTFMTVKYSLGVLTHF